MPDTAICSVCGKPIDPNASRFVDVDRVTKVKVHAHTECKGGPASGE